MDKKCVICGSVFQAPPSSKKVTCSPACRSRRAALAAKSSTGRTWSPGKREKRANDPDVIAKMASIQRVGTQAALEIPESQRGPQNRTSKIWVLIDPLGNRIPVVNLLYWCRENYTLFEPPCENVDKAACRIASGFRAIASSMRGVKSRQRPVSTYKGWGLAKIPIEKEHKE